MHGLMSTDQAPSNVSISGGSPLESEATIKISPMRSRRASSSSLPPDPDDGEGVSVPNLPRQLVTVLQHIDAHSEEARRNRIAAGREPGLIQALAGRLASCRAAERPLILRALSQLAFSCAQNSELIVREEGLVPYTLQLLRSSSQTLVMAEAANLINNLAATSDTAARTVAECRGALDTLKQLCRSEIPSMRTRALGILNCLSRHPPLVVALRRARVMDVVQQQWPAALREEQEGVEEGSMVALLVACIQANLLDCVQRRRWKADRAALTTIVSMIQCSLEGRTFVGVSCELQPILTALQALSASDHNKSSLVENGLLERLVQVDPTR